MVVSFPRASKSSRGPAEKLSPLQRGPDHCDGVSRNYGRQESCPHRRRQRLASAVAPPFPFRRLYARQLPPALTCARVSVSFLRGGGGKLEVWLRVRRASGNPNAARGAGVGSGRSSQVSGSRASASGRSPAGETPSPAFGVRFPGSVPDRGEHPGWVPPNLHGRTQAVLSPRRRHLGLASPQGDLVTAI